MKCLSTITSNKPVIFNGELTNTYVCNGEMIEVGGIGKSNQYCKIIGGKLCYGNEEVKLYQCEICKTIKLV